MMIRRLSSKALATVLAAALTAVAGPLAGQDAPPPSPLANLVIAGYGGMSYEAGLTSEFDNDFTASVSPVILYSMGDDLLFETELEFGLSGDLTTTTLEYAQIDYLGFDRVQLIGGKFLIPFGLFSERIHPTWINKLPTSPLLFGHAHGGVAEGSLLPILSDAGVMGRLNQPIAESWNLDLTLFVTQGPRLMTEEEGEGGAHGHSVLSTDLAMVPGHGQESVGEFDIPNVGFGVSFSDNNKNKMLGGRLGFVRAPTFEAHLSGFHAMYDEESFLDYSGLGVSVESRTRGFELRGEGAFTWQEFATAEGTFETLKSPGYYLQASRRIESFEPVIRWSHLPDATVNGEVARLGTEELMIGVNYWLAPSVPVKIAYGVHPDADDQIHLAWAFGF